MERQARGAHGRARRHPAHTPEGGTVCWHTPTVGAAHAPTPSAAMSSLHPPVHATHHSARPPMARAACRQ
eukprot:4535221-Prymnesium_polylepis.1